MDNCRPSVSVRTGARLHFGLLDTRAPFGGIGVMIDRPLTCVRVSAADRFDAGDVQPQRLSAIAGRLSQCYLGATDCQSLPRCAIGVLSKAPSHSGLGSGTQLALATATALATHFGLQLSRAELVGTLAGRGNRSAIGSLGFFEGGLISEDGMADDYLATPHWRRAEMPAQWRIVLARPQQFDRPVSGEAEGSAFASLAPAPPRTRNELVRLGEKIITAAEAADFDSFAAALTRFNRSSGALFAPQQGGCYNGPAVTKLVQQMQQAGARGYGQSSWGPTVFAFCASLDSARLLCERLGEAVVTIARPRLCGPDVTTG